MEGKREREERRREREERRREREERKGENEKKKKENERRRKGRKKGKRKRKRKECCAMRRLGWKRTWNCVARGRFPPTLVILRLGVVSPTGFVRFFGRISMLCGLFVIV